jgi:hypothetical protein
MCKSCARAVHTVRESLRAVHILCADLAGRLGGPVLNRRLSPISTQADTPYLYTHILTILYLFRSQLYPLSTVPIIRAIS